MAGAETFGMLKPSRLANCAVLELGDRVALLVPGDLSDDQYLNRCIALSKLLRKKLVPRSFRDEMTNLI